MALPQVTKGQQEKAVRTVGTEELLSPRRTAFFVFPLTIRHLGRKLLTMKKTYVLIQAPYTVIYAVIFPYVWPPTKWQQSAYAPPMTGEGKHGILVV